MVRIVTLLVAALFAGYVWADDAKKAPTTAALPPEAEQLLREQRAIQVPAATPDNAAKVNQALQKRADLALKFLQAYPDRIEGIPLLIERWWVLAGGQPEVVIAETQKVLEAQKDCPMKAKVLFARWFARCFPNAGTRSEIAQDVEDFIAAAPQDPRGAGMLMNLVRRTDDPDGKRALLQRVVEKYPSTDAARDARSELQ